MVHADREHLAHHLAFHALIHGDEHESWLADHVEAWESMGPCDLGARLGQLLQLSDPKPQSPERIERHPPVDRRSITTHATLPDNDLTEILDEAERLTRSMQSEDRPDHHTPSCEKQDGTEH